MLKTVRLNKAKFYAKHGYFEEEQKTGNTFIVDISVSQNIQGKLTDNLSDTIDYVELFETVKEEMNVVSKLLEDVIQRIINKIEDRYKFLSEIKLSIKKQSPPFGGNCESSDVQVVKNY